MRRAGDRVRPILANLGMESGLGLALVRQRWAGLFPGPLARHAAPSAIEGKTLIVTTDSPAWVQQLTFLKPQMMEKLSGLGISDMRFRVGRVTGWSGNETEPDEQPRKLTEEDMEFAAALMAGIRDPELAESVRAAFEEWAKRPSRRARAGGSGNKSQKKP